MTASTSTQPPNRAVTRRFGLMALAFLVTSPVAAVPITYVLMLIGGDYAFGPSGADSGIFLVALNRTFALLYITLMYIGEHILLLLVPLIAASAIFAWIAARPPWSQHRLALAVSVAGLLYPAIWIIAELLGWDAGMFN